MISTKHNLNFIHGGVKLLPLCVCSSTRHIAAPNKVEQIEVKTDYVELSWLYLAIINIQLEKTNQCKDARALKEPEGCRVDAPQQLN